MNFYEEISHLSKSTSIFRNIYPKNNTTFQNWIGSLTNKFNLSFLHFVHTVKNSSFVLQEQHYDILYDRIR